MKLLKQSAATLILLVPAMITLSRSASQEVVPVITSIQTKTADAPDAGMNFGHVDIEIINELFQHCLIDTLNADGNNFKAFLTHNIIKLFHLGKS